MHRTGEVRPGENPLNERSILHAIERIAGIYSVLCSKCYRTGVALVAAFFRAIGVFWKTSSAHISRRVTGGGVRRAGMRQKADTNTSEAANMVACVI